MMTGKQIRAAIVLATGKSIDEVAKEHGYSRFGFYYVINGRYKGQKVRDLIASIIDKPVDEIWPDSQPEGEINA